MTLSDADDGETVVFTARMPDGIIDRYDVSPIRLSVIMMANGHSVHGKKRSGNKREEG